MLTEPRLVQIAKEMALKTMMTMVDLLKEYKDVTASTYEDMKGLDPQFSQHQT